MSLIVDTSVWIEGFSSKIETPQKALLQHLIHNDYSIYLCPIIYQEILQGIREDDRYRKIKLILQQYKMVDLELMYVTNYAVDLCRHLRKKGITIRKSVDCLIASYAILGNMHLLHNYIDFTQIAKESRLKIYTAY